MFRKKSSIITILLTLLSMVYLFSIPGCGKTPSLEKANDKIGGRENSSTGFSFPAEIAGLKLGHFSQGEEAIANISKLHGKEIEIKNGYVAHYENDQAKAMFYISESGSEEQARKQIDLMREKIGKGTKSFGHFREFKVGGLSASQPQQAEKTIYSVLGFGQIHYFYLDSNRVIWLAIDPPVAESVLKAALKVIKSTQATQQTQQTQ